MDSGTTNIILTQLAAQSPLIIACMAGLIAALVLWQRCPRPALLTLIGTAMFMLAIVARAILAVYLFQLRREQGWSIERYGWITASSTLVLTVIQAVALGLVLAAVFSGRKADIRGG